MADTKFCPQCQQPAAPVDVRTGHISKVPHQAYRCTKCAKVFIIFAEETPASTST